MVLTAKYFFTTVLTSYPQISRCNGYFDGYIDGYPNWWRSEVKIGSWTFKIFGVSFLSGILFTTRDYVRYTWYSAVNCWAQLQEAPLSANMPLLHRTDFHSFTATVWDAPLSAKMDLLHRTNFSFIHRNSLRRSAFHKNSSFALYQFFIIHSNSLRRPTCTNFSFIHSNSLRRSTFR